MRMIRHSPIPCYTQHPLTKYGRLGAEFLDIATMPHLAVSQGMSYLLYGPPGNGKSSCVGALHRLLADKHILVHWVDCAEWPTGFSDRDEIVEDLCAVTCHILVLDDIGREPKHCRKDIERIVMSRAKISYRLDFMTCNLNVNTEDVDACELTEVYGSAVRSRLFGMCRRNVIHFNGPDHRMAVG